MSFNLAMIPNMIGSCAVTFEVGDRAPNPALNRTGQHTTSFRSAPARPAG
jgi:hypothetical protein